MAEPPVMGMIVLKRAMLLGCEFLNSTMVLMKYRAVMTIFLELAAAAEWLELLGTEGRTAEKATRMAVTAETTAL
jgi:hypothetical protein